MRRGRIGNLCFGEIELDGAHHAGNFTALEFMGAVALIDLTHLDGYIEVVFAARVSGGTRDPLFTMESVFAAAFASAARFHSACNNGYADKDDGYRQQQYPVEHVEHQELNDRGEGDQRDWPPCPLELPRDEQNETPEDEQGREPLEDFADAVHGDEFQFREQ